MVSTNSSDWSKSAAEVYLRSIFNAAQEDIATGSYWHRADVLARCQPLVARAIKTGLDLHHLTADNLDSLSTAVKAPAPTAATPPATNASAVGSHPEQEEHTLAARIFGELTSLHNDFVTEWAHGKLLLNPMMDDENAKEVAAELAKSFHDICDRVHLAAPTP